MAAFRTWLICTGWGIECRTEVKGEVCRRAWLIGMWRAQGAELLGCATRLWKFFPGLCLYCPLMGGYSASGDIPTHCSASQSYAAFSPRPHRGMFFLTSDFWEIRSSRPSSPSFFGSAQLLWEQWHEIWGAPLASAALKKMPSLEKEHEESCFLKEVSVESSQNGQTQKMWCCSVPKRFGEVFVHLHHFLLLWTALS